ncbi:Protein CBG21558 [Caenorhabditis briggsae]|uniref:Protein CBG21558 n=1 Tax=Caenorhabditis briggsae TaxID=6238 RepID=A8Y0D5_CAEBR|nr:Protein CBG21558 [Caenorhabditis briggsae]CAP38320.1 Protein CBG21558 [Caenorhabditis briggsae]
MFQLSRCLDHDGCPVLEQFEVYARLTRNYATSLSNSTCITPETIPGIVKICNRRPRPPSDHVESPCNNRPNDHSREMQTDRKE